LSKADPAAANWHARSVLIRPGPIPSRRAFCLDDAATEKEHEMAWAQLRGRRACGLIVTLPT